MKDWEEAVEKFANRWLYVAKETMRGEVNDSLTPLYQAERDARVQAETLRDEALKEMFRGETIAKEEKRIEEALEIISSYGGIDGSHHKIWVIDQVLRALTGDDYQEWVADYEEDENYEWDEGIAP